MTDCMGFDFGLKHVGVAVGQRDPWLITPVKVLAARGGQPCWLELDALMADWDPEVLVVGRPLNVDGSEQPLTGHATGFMRQLRRRYQRQTHGVDERYTTRSACASLFEQGGFRALQKSRIDLHCAEQICELWLLESRMRFT